MIQDIEPHRYDNTYKPEPPSGESIALYYEAGKCLINLSEEGIRFPTFAELETSNPEIYKSYYVFIFDR